eukprot:1414561-Amphidinium_carterae.1
MAAVLKSMQALQHYQGGHQRTVAPRASQRTEDTRSLSPSPVPLSSSALLARGGFSCLGGNCLLYTSPSPRDRG